MERNIIWESFTFDFQKEQEETSTWKDGDEIEAQKLMSTPFGLYEVNNEMNPFKRFDFWMGHANFKLTSRVRNILDNMLGVETLTILTPYCFIVSFGKAFNDTDVKIKIENALCGKHVVLSLINALPNKDLKVELKSKYKQVKDSKHWLFYVLPNGKIVEETFRTKDALDTKLTDYRHARNISEGILISSNDENHK